ncbi:MAG: amino acid ABC transporter permease [Clostridia bacterium]|nr:amino acid ABC transporter permease [Clostridia bacterium]
MKESFFESVWRVFIENGGLKLMLRGVGNTVIIAVLAVLIGVVLGSVCAMIKVSDSKNPLMVVLKALVGVYITVIRGTPLMVQLLFTYFGMFALVMRDNPNKALIIAIIVFGINSGAYVAEIIRSGILAVDVGQTEAGRSLGLSSRTTMLRIVLPQAIKNIIPALGNEFIMLIKDSSLASAITVVEMTKRAQSLVAKFYLALPIYLILALFYLVLTSLAAQLMKVIEKRLRKSDNR